MLTSACLGTNNIQKAGVFYDIVLGTIDMERLFSLEHEMGYGPKGGEPNFYVVNPYNEEPATFGNGTQIIFRAPCEDAVKAFHAAILANGGSDEGAPGPRDYNEGYYGAYGRDLDQNKLHVFFIK